MANFGLEEDSADRRILLVMDIASIHKVKFIKSIISNKRISIFTITPYEAWLNAEKKLILAMKIRALQNRGCTMLFISVKSIADEIEKEMLVGMIKATFKESIQNCQTYLI